MHSLSNIDLHGFLNGPFEFVKKNLISMDYLLLMELKWFKFTIKEFWDITKHIWVNNQYTQ